MQVRRDLRSDRAGAGVDERECVAPVRHPECAIVMARGPNLSARVADPSRVTFHRAGVFAKLTTHTPA